MIPCRGLVVLLAAGSWADFCNQEYHRETQYRYLKALVFPPKDYDRDSRPGGAIRVLPSATSPEPYLCHTPLRIAASLFLSNVQDIRADTSAATVTWRVHVSWVDRDLAWDSSNVTLYNLSLARLLPSIYVPQASIWFPHVHFDYNAVDSHRRVEEDVAKVEADGTVSAMQVFTVRTAVDLKICDFPYDGQTIYTKMSFGHISEDHIRIDLLTRNLTDQYDQRYRIFDSTEWIVKSLDCYSGGDLAVQDNYRKPKPGSRFIDTQDGKSFVLCKVRVIRKHGFYILNFVVPSFLITFLGISGQFTHELRKAGTPPNKTQIALAAVMSLGILTISMGNSVPRESSVTKLHRFYFTMVGLTITAAISSAVSLPAVFRKESPAETPDAGKDGKMASPGATEYEKSPKWQWRFQAALFTLHLVVLFSALGFLSQGCI